MVKKITVLTIFPEIIESYISKSIPKRAQLKGLVEIEVVNIRSHPQEQVDDYAYGGGSGMVLKIEPILSRLRERDLLKDRVIYLTPSGKTLNNEMAKGLSECGENLVLICGHYEGIDERLSKYIDEEISIGDYVLSSGELSALVLLDSVVRLIPKVISEHSLKSESFSDYLLDYPVYTRPQEFEGDKVPEVYLSGDHKAIEEYRLEMRKKITKEKRPDLYEKYLKLNEST
ncbi:tRNA (Guanine-N(1)-)-methyltransferase [Mycoplasma haemofelis str. Langford 1]|uniref:tRNA (guanine-N(1)-)-methyltransferase n=2 Tax=Mycoplasma haemofelis TaxID=29501 RepID=F6FIH3_MYCHI|nr:tRNA (guanosine(37)-N1)-methyltransferase TrmD [Mycoplasma haemofelis]AEG73021.1 tRNA (guanine-N1)-methyltransferase [Mycoplasma haemofelis Ohio2]CBY92687.1 tRNA (Guanine-N(1)-)-methyltransferase [Mycoplasma haemofelis str. Langford 1]